MFPLNWSAAPTEVARGQLQQKWCFYSRRHSDFIEAKKPFYCGTTKYYHKEEEEEARSHFYARFVIDVQVFTFSAHQLRSRSEFCNRSTGKACGTRYQVVQMWHTQHTRVYALDKQRERPTRRQLWRRANSVVLRSKYELNTTCVWPRNSKVVGRVLTWHYVQQCIHYLYYAQYRTSS